MVSCLFKSTFKLWSYKNDLLANRFWKKVFKLFIYFLLPVCGEECALSACEQQAGYWSQASWWCSSYDTGWLLAPCRQLRRPLCSKWLFPGSLGMSGFLFLSQELDCRFGGGTIMPQSQHTALAYFSTLIGAIWYYKRIKRPCSDFVKYRMLCISKGFIEDLSQIRTQVPLSRSLLHVSFELCV